MYNSQREPANNISTAPKEQTLFYDRFIGVTLQLFPLHVSLCFITLFDMCPTIITHHIKLYIFPFGILFFLVWSNRKTRSLIRLKEILSSFSLPMCLWDRIFFHSKNIVRFVIARNYDQKSNLMTDQSGQFMKLFMKINGINDMESHSIWYMSIFSFSSFRSLSV